MLQTVKLKNYVHFEDETIEIDNDGGPMFFMGENNSGKSCVFEAVRRCMSTSKNLGMSSPHNADKLMFVTCHFQTKGAKEKNVFSSVFRPAGNRDKDNCDEYVIKLVYVNYEDEDKCEFACDIVKRNGKHMVCKQLPHQATSELKSIYEQHKMDLGKEFQSKLNEYGNEIKCLVDQEGGGQDSLTACEKILKEQVDQTTVLTFPLRSISPYQWSNSERLKSHTTTDNIKGVDTNKAEILFWYLTDETITEEEKEKEKQYFNILTGNCSFEFQLDKNQTEIIALNGNFREGIKKPIFILRVPEGIYEAKRMAILLSLDRFKTICLDDPDRGMHIQMIDRLRDLILKKISDKVIVLTSHHPSFLSPWTIHRTMLFRRHKHQNEHTFKIIPMRRISTGETHGGEKTARIIASYNFATTFLARIVIFVEGDDDLFFLKELKQILLTDEIVEQFEQICGTKKDELKEVLYPLQIVPMVGEANKVRFPRVVSLLEIPHLFLLDYDALFNNIPQPAEKYEHDIYPFFKAFELDCSPKNCKRVEEDVSIPEENGIFVWKKTQESNGTLDSSIQEFCRNENLVDVLKDNNVKLTKTSRPSSRESQTKDEGENKGQRRPRSSKKKLFNDSKVTNENITNVVTKILGAALESQNTNNEIIRLVNFLSRACRRESTNFKFH